MEQYEKIQQLLKKEPGTKERVPIFPPTVIQAVFDGKTGASLEAILAQFNNIYVQFQGSAKDTRNLIPETMRRSGLTITYVNMDGEAVSERASSAVKKEDEYWGADSNWLRMDNLFINRTGETKKRPALTLNDEGFHFYDTEIDKPIWWNGTDWINACGYSVGLKTSGSTYNRPDNPPIGFQYYDTDIKKPIYWDGESWYDANGTKL